MGAIVFEEALETRTGLQRVQMDLKSFWAQGTAQVATVMSWKKGDELLRQKCVVTQVAVSQLDYYLMT